MMDFLLDATTIATLLLIWFNTGAIVAYLKLFKIPLVMQYLEDYEKQDRKSMKFSNFIEYLNYRWPDSFFVELVSCPICLSFWFSFILTLSASAAVLTLPLMYLALVCYYLLTFLIERH